MRTKAARCCFLFALFAFGSRLALCQGTVSPKHTVLVLIIDQPGREFARDMLDGIREATRDSIDITLFIEFNGPTALETPDIVARRQQLHRTRYASQPIEIIVPLGARVLAEAAQLRDELFPSAKIIFGTEAPQSIPPELGQGEGFNVNVNPFRSFLVAHSLLPKTSNLVVIGGMSKVDEILRQSFLDSVRNAGIQTEATVLSGVPLSELREQVAQVPKNSMIVLTSGMADRSGRATTLADQARELSSVANAPIVEGTDLAVNSGALGGDVVSMKLTGVEIGKRIRHTLETGEAPGGVVIHDAPRRKVLDWRQLQRFGISDSKIPPEFELLNRQPTLWEEHRVAVLAVIGGLVLQTILISFLLTERRHRTVAQDQNRAMLASLPGFVLMIDGTGKILQLNNRPNPKEAELPRSWATASAGQNFVEILREGDEMAAQLARALDEVVEGKRNSLATEYRYETSRETRWVEIHAESLHAQQHGAVVAVTDITERKKSEAENAQNRQTAWHLNRVAALGELTASLAHEINQPLAAILNSAEAAAMLLKRPAPDIEESLEAISDIIEDDKRAGAVIRKMRSLLKPNYEGTQSIDLDATVRETLRLVVSEARLRHVTLHHVPNPGLPPIAADPTQLQQVILNLVTNGIESAEAMPDNRTVEIRTSHSSADGMQVLEVCDSGLGIAPEKLGTIFEPFYTTKREGLGLGLAICRSIVESFGGKISAETNEAGGATFRVTLRPFQTASPKVEAIRQRA